MLYPATILLGEYLKAGRAAVLDVPIEAGKPAAPAGSPRWPARGTCGRGDAAASAPSGPAQEADATARRVAIARALANQPRIILADEPTAALDSERAVIVMDLLRGVARDNDAAVVVVTHDEKIFDRLDEIFYLRDGRLVPPEVAPALPQRAVASTAAHP